MEKLLTKIGAPSYLPTPAEVIDGVRWLRENPAIAAGVVVGLTSYSVAKYYEYGEDSDDNDDNDEATDAISNCRATRDEIARSVTAVHFGLLKISGGNTDRHSNVDSSSSTASSFASSGGLRSRASSVFDKSYHEDPQIQEQDVDQAWSCLHGDECPPGDSCSADWGLFTLPTSPKRPNQ